MQCFYLPSILLICGLNQVLRFVQPISYSFSFMCAGVLGNRRPVSLSIRFAYSRYEDSQRQYIGADIFISWIGVADRIYRMTIRLTWHRLFKKWISSANTIGAVIKERSILTPLPLFVETIPIQKAVTSGDGNIEFYRETTCSNLK